MSLAASADGATPSVQKQSAPVILRDSTLVIGNGTTGPYFVSGYFIIVGSESVHMRQPGESAIQNTDYSLDHNKGWIRFARPVPTGDSVIVSFVRLATVCPTELRAAQPAAAELTLGQIVPVSQVLVDGFEPPSKASPYRPNLPNPSALQWRGYKSFSVSTSSGRTADWSQGLDLGVSGEVTQGLQLTAALSDRVTGNSTQSGPDATRLGDLDRLYIEANSARFNGRWGNLAIVDATSGPTTRHATGLKLGWRTPASRAGTYIGYASGELVRRTLSIQPGDAGPYRLIDQAGIAVVPGSIALTVDNKRFREGASADYIFDPQQNAITFNPSVALAGRPQAVVEFEQTVDSYRRLLAGGEWSWADSARPVKLSTAAHWESDDPDRPMFGNLSDAQRHLLAQTPNSEITIPAANYAGQHRGDYRLDINNATDSVFVYVGPNNGDWRVSFKWVGVGQGRYRHLAESAYEFVGKGRGAYEPTATLGAPQTHADLTQAFDVRTSSLGRFDGLWSGNLDDANRLSQRSTRFLSDHRLRWSLGGKSSTATNGEDDPSQGTQASLEWRRIGSTNQRTSQIDDLPRFLRAWGIRSALFDSSRSDYQLALSTARPGQLDISTEAGLLTAPNLRAWRLSLASSNRIWKSLSANLKLNHRYAAGLGAYSNGHDHSTQYESRLLFSPKPAQFETGWRQDRLSNNSRMFEPAPDLAMARWIKLARGPVSTEYRWETVHDSTLLARRTRELSLSASTDIRNSSQGRVTLARGQQSVGNGSYTPYYRGQLAETWRPTDALSFTADLRLTRGHSGAQREVYLPTIPGQGQYRLERSEYIPDLHGDYRRVIAPADDTNQDTYDGEQRLSCTWRPTALGWRWTLESQLERNAQYDPVRFRPGVWLLTWNAHQSAYLSNSRSQERRRLRFAAQPDQATELSLGWVSDKALITGDGQSDIHDQYQFTARRHLNNSWYLQSDVSRDQRRRVLSGSAGIASRATTLSATLGAAPANGLSWSLEGRRRAEREATLNNSVLLWGLRPTLHSTVGPVVLSAETDATWVSSGRQGSLLSALLAEGRPPGFSVTQFCELRVQLPGKITVRSNLNADLRNQGPNRWRWELETTAAF